MARQFTLGKNERLKSRKQIDQLFSGGQSFSVTPLKTYYLITPGVVSAMQMGVGVGAKNFKKAVDRNRIKRLVREAWRLQKNDLKEKIADKSIQINVFLIYTSKEQMPFQDISKSIAVILDKISKRAFDMK